MSLKSLATSLLILPIISTAALAENGYNWDGIYLGAVIGLQSSKINGATMTGASPTSTDLSGVSGGLTAGVNFTILRFLELPRF
jgi:opacity protein-like surface antigen